MQEELVRSSRIELILVFGAVFCLLLLVCANVASLAVARSVARAREKLHIAYDWLDANLGEGPWAAGERFTLADCAAAPSLFYADWIEEIGPKRPKLAAYRARLLAHPIVARAVDEGRPYRSFFPLGAPDRD